MSKIIGSLLLFVAVTGSAFASVVPEIDPSSGGTALALLAGGLLILRSRRKK